MTPTPPAPPVAAERDAMLDKHNVAILERALADIDTLHVPNFTTRALRLLVAERLMEHRSAAHVIPAKPSLFDKTEVHDKAVEARRAAAAEGGGANVTDIVSGRQLAAEQARANSEARRAELAEVRWRETALARDNLKKALASLTASVALVDKAAEPVCRSAGVEGFVIIPAGAWKNLVVAAGDIARDYNLKFVVA